MSEERHFLLELHICVHFTEYVSFKLTYDIIIDW